MKIELQFDANELAADFIDAFVAGRLKEHRDMLINWKGYRHKDDIKQHKRLVKAINEILDYYSAADE